MKKLVALAGALLVALIAPAGVGAAAKVYVGEFETSGEVQFKVKQTEHGKKIKEFDWFGFPLLCETGPKTSTGGLSFAPKVRDGRFVALAYAGNDPNDPKASLRLTGKLKGNGKAEGTMRIEGKKVPVNEPPGSDKCTSPRTDWTATIGNSRAVARSSAPSHSPWATLR